MTDSKILISGQRCAGKSTLFWKLQKELGWPTFSVSQFLRDYVRERALKDHEIREHDEIMGKEIDERVRRLLASPYPVIIEVRAFKFIRDTFPGTLKVLLTAKETCRVQRSSFREKIDVHEAAKRLRKKDEEWMERVGQQFGFGDFYNPAYYDLVVETDGLSPGQVLERVLSSL